MSLLVVGVLDEPYSAKPAHPYRLARLHRMDTAYVDWRACTATPLSRIS